VVLLLFIKTGLVDVLRRFFLFILLSISQPLMALDLIDVYQLALQQDVELKIARSQYLSAAEALPLASSQRYPQINFSANITDRDSDSSVPQGGLTSRSVASEVSSYGFSINLTQNIYNAETLAGIDIAEAEVARALAEFESSQHALMIRVAERYFDILAAEDNVEFAVAEKNSIDRQLEQAQKRFEVGLIAITDVHEAQARYDSAVAQQLLAENLLENAYRALEVIISQVPSLALARLGDQLELSIPTPTNSDQWVDLALQNNRSLVSSLAALNVAKHQRDQQSKGDYPTVDFTARSSGDEFDDDDLGSYDQQDLTLAFQLNVPLYTGGRIDAAKQQAEFSYQAARDNALLQRRLVSQQTRDNYLGVVSGISQVKALRQALSSSTTALEATEAGFEVGTRTSVDVLVSLRETYGAERDYASARYDYLLNILRLKQAAGILSQDDLLEVNRWLVN
jgi:outer membrane protein